METKPSFSMELTPLTSFGNSTQVTPPNSMLFSLFTLMCLSLCSLATSKDCGFREKLTFVTGQMALAVSGREITRKEVRSNLDKVLSIVPPKHAFSELPAIDLTNPETIFRQVMYSALSYFMKPVDVDNFASVECVLLLLGK
jgi:hypothetical protein